MTEQLVKWFVKDGDQTDKQEVRTRYGILSSIVGVICNFILFFIKITIGMILQSISVMADAFNNLSDAASSIISFAGVKLANRPADKEHPFGHGRYEYIAALVVAFLVLQVGLSCLKSSIEKILNPAPIQANLILVGILCLSILMKVWLGLFNKNLGSRINSKVMKATAADAFGDVLVTSATVFSVIIGMLTGWKIDGCMGLIVSIFVLLAGFNIAKDTLEPLIGVAATREEYEKITKFVEKYEGIEGTHDLIVHNYGPSKTMATIHAEVPKNVEIEKSHEIIDRIERDAAREMGVFLVIHMDPVEINNETITALKRLASNIVREQESQASIHDFRMVNGENRVNLIFDLVVPHSYKEEQEEKLRQEVMRRMAENDSRYQCVITVEHSYVANE